MRPCARPNPDSQKTMKIFSCERHLSPASAFRLGIAILLASAFSGSRLVAEVTLSSDNPAVFLTIHETVWGNFPIGLSAERAWGKGGFKTAIKEAELVEESHGKLIRKFSYVGSEKVMMRLTLGAVVSGTAVDLTADLESDSPLPGSFAIILTVPVELAADLTVLANGKEMTVNRNRGAVSSKPSEVSLVQTSTGRVIMKITGEMSAARTHFFAQDEQKGLSLWLHSPSPEAAGSPFKFPLHFEFPPQ